MLYFVTAQAKIRLVTGLALASEAYTLWGSFLPSPLLYPIYSMDRIEFRGRLDGPKAYQVKLSNERNQMNPKSREADGICVKRFYFLLSIL